MILLWIIFILMAGGVLAGIVARWSSLGCRIIALASVTLNMALITWIWINQAVSLQPGTTWITDINLPWIPSFGISFHLALDGLSLLMLALTFFIGIFAVLLSWNEIQSRIGFFHFNLLWVLAGIAGVFVTMDLFLLYFFWEVMLIPMYFLIGIWGHANRQYAAYKFFIFTQASGLLMLLAILGLYFVHGTQTSVYTFNYFDLLQTPMSQDVARWLMLGFLAAFLVKLPIVPFHTWLPDAHSEAPTAGSFILAGLMLKTGAYGLIRFAVPLFPGPAIEFAPWAMLIGVVGIIYGAVQAFSQTDLKRLVAYTSVSHMGFVILGVFAFTEMALQGVVMQMITHAISTGALFVLAGALYERIHTRDILQMGGFWKRTPFMATVGLIFVMASLGLPGLGNFVAEFLTLMGSWSASPILTAIATAGLVAATAYSLRIMQKIFLGKETHAHILPDLSLREKLVLVPMAITIITLGLFPQRIIDTAQAPVVKTLPDKETIHALHQQHKTTQSPAPGMLSAKGGIYEQD